MMKMPIIALGSLLACAVAASAQLILIVSPPKVTGQKAVVPLVLKNNFTKSEPYTPTIARVMPMMIIKRWNGFSATNQVKARLHQTEPPNALPASWRCLSRSSSSAKADPSQPRMSWEVFSLATSSSFLVMAATIPAMSST